MTSDLQEADTDIQIDNLGPDVEMVRRYYPVKTMNYTAAQDDRLTAEAVGVLWYLLSKPKGWQMSFWDIARHFKLGRMAMRTISKCLIEAGYLQRIEYRNAQGQTRTRWRFFDEPQPVQQEE